jgi:hypothetical protein
MKGTLNSKIKTSDGPSMPGFEIKPASFPAVFIWEQEIGGSSPPAPTTAWLGGPGALR